MAYKKTSFSIFLWIAYTCITGVILSDYANLLWRKQINIDNPMYMRGFVILFFVLSVFLFVLFRKVLSPHISGKIYENTKFVLETFAVIGIFVIGFIYRLFHCFQNAANGIVETNFYKMAILREGSSVDNIVHGASYLYAQFLSLAFSFLGNKIMAAVWIQVFIQMLTIVLAYFIIRKMLGIIPACTVMLTLSISTVYTGEILTLTPETFYFLLYIIGLFIIGSYVKSYCRNLLSDSGKISGAVFCGIVVGILSYLDAVSLTLFIILFGLINGIHISDLYADDTYDANREQKRRKTVSALLFILTIAAFVFTMAGIFVLDSLSSGDSINIVYNAWIKLYTGQAWVDNSIYRDNYSLAGCIIQMVLAALTILTFWNDREEQSFTPWICLMITTAPMSLSGVSVLRYQVFYVFVWSILAGLGIQQSLGLKAITDRHKSSESEAAETENVAEDIADSAAAAGKPRFIENPLPVPKKHEKKEMDYQYYVPERKMKYDIVVPDNDDFDI